MSKINLIIILAALVTLTGCGLDTKQQSSVPVSTNVEPIASATIQALPSSTAASTAPNPSIPPEKNVDPWLGKWILENSNDANGSTLTITRVENKVIHFSLDAFRVTNPAIGAVNVGNINQGKATLTGQTATFKDDDFTLTITSHEDRLEVKSSQASGYFGMGVTADGVYHRTITPSTLTYLLPEGWHLLEKDTPAQAEGDLNQDGIADLAMVIEKNIHSEQAAPRMLLIAWGNNDQTYTVSIKSEHAVLKADEGGVWGDPFESISIDRGSVLLHFYGGSNHRWFSSYRFRYQDQDWYLIGATLGSYFTGTMTKENADLEDYNLLTGEYIIRKTDEMGNVNTTKGNRGKKALVKLADFNVRSENQF